MAIRRIIKVALIAGMVLAISYLFNANLYLALVIVAVLGVLVGVVHMPENMPGEYDNPEGKDLHPAKAIGLGALVVSVLIVVGYLFPELYNYGFNKNS